MVTANAETLNTTGKWLMIKWAYGQDNIFRSSLQENLGLKSMAQSYRRLDALAVARL
jgi:hypothetical protein